MDKVEDFRSSDYIDEQSRWATVGELTVHYKRQGVGHPVVLLHGSGSSLQSFDRVTELLVDSFEVVRLDLPGFGLTGPRPDRDYRITAVADVVAQVLDVLDLRRAVVGGSSLGGNVAWNFGLDYPDRASGLVLINATGYPGKSLPLALRLAQNPLGRVLLRRLSSPRTTARNLRSLVGSGSLGVVDDAMVRRVYAMMTRPGNQQAFIDFANTEQLDRTGELSTVAAPTLVLRSEGVDGQHFAEQIPGSVERINPRTGHLLPEEDPEWVADQLRQFMAEVIRIDSTKD